ncbi:hypothetical protein C8A01DRAFT_12763 [Parachaetomium inaequale]|uniref:Zn(2)-C6 fungal-type domain-containing protein n=1 Tax=Parachaetomium inaequale TaxID=2588326 RepID=A0AAN6PMI8_9PEZI|nr:hypothetical protein C8A01DRAFT_12763 [Parachaetomium inaequale]
MEPSGPPMVPPPPDLGPEQLQPEGAQSAVVRRRAPIACRRCRRMRSKCHHDKAKPPCRSCLEAGLGPSDCVFPVRGQPDQDREYRHPRVRADKSKKRDETKVRRESRDALAPPRSNLSAPLTLAKGSDDWDLLPPLPEIIESLNQFTRHYFQLGFIPKQLFPERLRTQHRSVSVFFLLGILSVSARLTPALVERYGSAVRASEAFMERASALAQNELYREPALERCQAFYLLSIAQQGSGLKHRSSINMAVAMRMATLMQLHREETYVVPNPTKELIIRAESARRTLWMLHSQDNLHSGPRSPVLLSASDITALLPSNENDFANAREPKSRAALEGTPPALENPALVADEGRSLFATLIQAHHYWGAIYRRAINNNRSVRPWEPDSEYAQMERRLAEWETGLPNDYRWSSLLLKGYKQEGQDLAYLGVTMITRLCNIVTRKAYLHEMISHDKSDPDLTAFWADMAHKLFWNVNILYEQIETHYADKSPDEGPGAQMAAFCVYTCGFLACYPCKFPNICSDPSIARNAPMMVQRILNILAESKNIWPLASRWYDHLEKFYNSQNAMTVGAEGSMADSREPIPHVLHPTPNPPTVKPIQPRIVAPAPDEKNGAPPQSPNMSMLTLQQQQQPTPTVYTTDPNLRLSVSQQQPPPPNLPPQQQQQQVALAHGQAPQQATSGGARPTTDGLGLLIEAFDTHQTAAEPPQVQGEAGPVETSAPPPPPGAVYDPHVVPQQQQQQQQQYYPQQQALATMNDGYEHELGCYMSDGVPPPGMQQGWAGAGGGGDMYGY